MILTFLKLLVPVFSQSSTVTALIIDESQDIYLGSTTGLSKMDADSRQMTRIMDGVSVSALALSKRHGVYAACNGNEIWTADGKRFLELEDSNVAISCMMISGAQLWVGSNNGIYVISLNRQEVSAHHTTQNSVLGSDQINTMYVDGSGIKWIGTNRGVVRIEGEKRWRMYEEATRFTAIAGNNEGAWLAGDTEMWLVDPYNRWTPTAVKEGLSSGEIRAVATDKQGRVYVLSDIFIQFDPAADIIIPINDQAASAVAHNVALAVDNNDQLWVASSQEELKVIDPEISITLTPLLGTLILTHPSCEGVQDGSIKISVQGGQPPYLFSWSHSQQFTRDHATGLSAGSYEVIITDYAGNEYRDAAELFEPVELDVLISEDRSAEGYALVVDASGGRGEYTYQWSDGGAARKIAIQAAGTYAVTVTDINGCSKTTAYALNESVFARPDLDAEIPVEEQPLEAVTVENLKVLDPEELNVGQILRIEQLQFQADSSDIESASFAVLDGIYDFLTENDRIVIEISGHTNGLPDHAYCDRLSTARAKSVAEYIIGKGIPQNRIAFRGYGKRQPIATNQSIEGRRKNQRVEVKILQM
ncbi:MAG TPA: OmpA family protein [Saprospiraceae bacterium]|nr:OmpA family protein [Saprospiraceae bacterium]